jgi:alkylation response protein AidB-like acyl-CoA dehydrogenase
VDLSLTSEQEQLLDVAKEFVRAEVLPNLRGGAFEAGSPRPFELWRLMGELGWFSLAVPEDRGGLAGTPMDVAMLLQGLGTGPVPGPLFEDIALLPNVLTALGWPVDQELIDAFMGGQMRVAVGLPACGRGPAAATMSTLSTTGSRVSGEVYPVREVGDATHYLVLSRRRDAQADCELILFPAGSEGITLEPLAGFVPGQGRLVFNAVDTTDAVVITLSPADVIRVGEAVLESVPALCAFQIGSCESVLQMSVSYSKQRVQFGRPIGAFQRVQDHVIELLNGLDSARWTTYYALAGLSAAEAADWSAIHVAKAATSVAHFRGCDSAHEVHAGIGTDVDYGLAAHTYVSRCLYPYLGSPPWHRKRLTHELGLVGAGGESASTCPPGSAVPAPAHD